MADEVQLKPPAKEEFASGAADVRNEAVPEKPVPLPDEEEET